MTLGEALARTRTPPKIGDHEVVLDEHGVAHVLVITDVDSTNPRSLQFMSPCGVFKPGTDTNTLVIAPHISCLTCASKV